MVKFLQSLSEFEVEFKKACEQFHTLQMYTAWAGDPKNLVPFKYLPLLDKVHAIVGISFCQSNPDGIRFLMKVSNEIRIADPNQLFHPKVYIFSKDRKRMIFIGSSNFTFQGFYTNHEVNVCISSVAGNEQIENFEKGLRKWHSGNFSFIPDERWLRNYIQRYNKRRLKLNDSGVKDESQIEEEYATSSWLANADWDEYLKLVRRGIRNHTTRFHESLSRKMKLLDRCSTELSLPWKKSYFKDLEKRRLIGGINPYGWLGHVSASGDFRRMLKNGTAYEHRTIVTAINKLCEMVFPLDFKEVEDYLNNLTHLGPTMKVWGRLLTIMRPDLYCTISSPNVRQTIAQLTDTSENAFCDVPGYLSLLNVIHLSPWYRSKRPTEIKDAQIWDRRMAFLDVVLYR